MPYRTREYKLDRMRDLLERLDNPQDKLAIVHIAGTKGKGSTAAMLASILTAANYSTGVFSSPHLDRLEERLTIDGVLCPEDVLVQLVARLREVVAEMDAEAASQGGDEIGPTYFELTTALALLHFVSAEVDFAVLEVGMGGRLDSTNVCTPVCTAITSISFDHTRQLGNTLAAIAGEKAGIIKPGIPIVCGVTDAEPQEVIHKIAETRGAPLVQLNSEMVVRYKPPVHQDDNDSRNASLGKIHFQYHQGDVTHDLEDLSLGLLGSHQARNAAVALGCIAQLAEQGWQIPEEAIARGLASTRCRARIEVISQQPTVVIDAAHNVTSIEALLQVLDESFAAGPRLLVFSTTQEKDVRGMLEQLVPRFDEIIFTRYLNNPRSVPPEELAATAASLGATHTEICPSPEIAWQTARKRLSAEHLLCVTGSFFIAAEMRREIVT